MVVPTIWVKDDTLFFPPKNCNLHIQKWTFPQKDWKKFKVVKTLLPIGTKQRCEEFDRTYVDSSQGTQQPNNTTAADTTTDSDATSKYMNIFLSQMF